MKITAGPKKEAIAYVKNTPYIAIQPNKVRLLVKGTDQNGNPLNLYEVSE